MLRLTKIALVVSVLLLPDYYILESPFRIRTILLAVLLIVYLLDHIFKSNRTFQMSRDTKNVLLAAYAFLIYIYISDVIKNDPIEAGNIFYPHLLIPVVLLIFEYRRKSFDLYKVLYLIFGISILFAVLQIIGLRENLSTLIPELGFIKSDQVISLPGPQGLRVSGAAYSIINFAECLGFLIIITYYRFTEKRNKISILSIILMIVVLFFTQTRSAIYGLVPSIFLVGLYYRRKNFKEVLRLAIFLVIVFFTVSLFSNLIEKSFHRLTTLSDWTVIERMQTNYYAMLGVWRRAPIFGIPKEMAWDVISRTAWEEGLIFGDILRISATHHNQVLYYFRYYGFVGLGLLMLLYYMIFRKIVHSSQLVTKMILLSIFLFDFQYSLGHNNKLINNIILWILLSLTTVAVQNKLRNATGNSVSLPVV